MRHPLAIISSITLGLTILLCCLVGYWLFYPDNVTTISNSDSVPVNKTTYTAGEHITYTLSYCKTRSLTGKVMRALVDGYRTVYETVYSNLPVGCHTINVNELVIPSFTPTGKYYLTGTTEYAINPLRTVSNSWKTVEFNVINKEQKEI